MAILICNGAVLWCQYRKIPRTQFLQVYGILVEDVLYRCKNFQFFSASGDDAELTVKVKYLIIMFIQTCIFSWNMVKQWKGNAELVTEIIVALVEVELV